MATGSRLRSEWISPVREILGNSEVRLTEAEQALLQSIEIDANISIALTDRELDILNDVYQRHRRIQHAPHHVGGYHADQPPQPPPYVRDA